MKKLFISLVLVFAFLLKTSLAEIRTIDLSDMTLQELDALIEEIKAEKKNAADIPAIIKDQLIGEFKSFLSEIAPEGATIKYPFLGLDISRERECYIVYGNCNAKLPDKQKKVYQDAHAVYWYNKDNACFYRIAFYDKEEVFAVNSEYLSKVAKFLSNDIVERLESAQNTNETIKLTIPIPKEISDQEKVDAIYAEYNMGYDFAYGVTDLATHYITYNSLILTKELSLP